MTIKEKQLRIEISIKQFFIAISIIHSFVYQLSKTQFHMVIRKKLINIRYVMYNIIISK